MRVSGENNKPHNGWEAINRSILMESRMVNCSDFTVLVCLFFFMLNKITESEENINGMVASKPCVHSCSFLLLSTCRFAVQALQNVNFAFFFFQKQKNEINALARKAQLLSRVLRHAFHLRKLN